MTGPFRSDIERLLSEALAQEAEAAMSMTDTRKELDRFRAANARRRVRVRIFAVAAAVAVVVAAIVAGTTLGSTAGRRGEQVGHIVPRPTVAHATLPGVPTRLPSNKIVTLPNVGFVPTFALGSVWTADEHSLYRVAADGRRVESTITYRPATYLSVNGDPIRPFAVGASLLVPAIDRGHNAYLILDAQGRQHGELRVAAAGPGRGDSTGAWAVTGRSTLSRLSSDGRRITGSFRFPGTQLFGVDEGGGFVWLMDNVSSTVLKVDPDTGKVVGHSPNSVDPVNAMLYADNAVYLTTEAYDLRRIDPDTMKVTAIESVSRDNQWGWQFVAAAPDGSLWTNAGDTAVAQLNPRTLHPLSFTTITTDNLGYHNGGTGSFAVTNSHVYVAGTSKVALYSIARSTS